MTDESKPFATGTPRVVVVGGGFGGLAAARKLGSAEVDVTLIDRRNHHLFQPLLYQVATAGLNPSDIAYPIRSILRRQRNARVMLGNVDEIIPQDKCLSVDGEKIGFDYLVLATGATHSYFGHDEWEKLAPGLKTIDDALEIRRRIFLAYEAAEREPSVSKRKAWLTFVVIGAGPTGVELAGTLAEIARHTLTKDFRNLDVKDVRVVLVEGLPEVLPSYPATLQKKARHQLVALGVEVRTQSMAAEVTALGVQLQAAQNHEFLPAHTVLWAAGVQASPLVKSLRAPLDRSGRVMVSNDLSVPGFPNIFVVGDLAAVSFRDKPVPGVAPAATQGGAHAAKSILADLARRPRKPFVYRDKGSLATIGRSRAVADFGRFRLSGFFAWFLWWAVHIFFLVGFRNRILVMFGWVWSYLTFQRGARLITGPYVPPKD